MELSAWTVLGLWMLGLGVAVFFITLDMGYALSKCSEKAMTGLSEAIVSCQQVMDNKKQKTRLRRIK